MKILVDTCTFLWLATDDVALSDHARDLATDPSNVVYLSAVSAWEIAIKARLGRLPLPSPPPEYVPARRRALQLERLDFGEEAAAHVALLPDLHADPFDRALVAQGVVGGLTILTPDKAIRAYPVLSRW